MYGPRFAEAVARLFPSPTARAIAHGAISGVAGVLVPKLAARQEGCAHARNVSVYQPLIRAHVIVCTWCGFIEIDETGR